MSWEQMARLGLKLATDIVGKVPSKGDSPLQVVVKMLSVVDSVQNILKPATKGSAMDALVAAYNLDQTKNEQFVSLFFETNLYQQFNTNRFSLTDYMEVIAAEHPKFGCLFFVEYSYSNDGPESTFYFTRGISFSDILDGLWESYDGRLHVTITKSELGNTKSEFASFNLTANPLYGSTAEQLDRLVMTHRQFTEDGYPRCYMFYGKPGVGKSSCAMNFAGRLSKRILKIDAQSLAHLHVKDITFLLTSLNPDFIIFDDVDKLDVENGMPTVLDVVQRFKNEYKATSIIMTADTNSEFDSGLLRPGRIDTWVEFKLPDPEERRRLLMGYLTEFNSKTVSDADMDNIVTATNKLSHDYIREVALQLRYMTPSQVLENITFMHKLLKTKSKKPKGGGTKAPKDSVPPDLPKVWDHTSQRNTT